MNCEKEQQRAEQVGQNKVQCIKVRAKGKDNEKKRKLENKKKKQQQERKDRRRDLIKNKNKRQPESGIKERRENEEKEQAEKRGRRIRLKSDKQGEKEISKEERDWMRQVCRKRMRTSGKEDKRKERNEDLRETPDPLDSEVSGGRGPACCQLVRLSAHARWHRALSISPYSLSSCALHWIHGHGALISHPHRRTHLIFSHSHMHFYQRLYKYIHKDEWTRKL